jgi:MerR family transcriptional regulator/heat shock protein HspR
MDESGNISKDPIISIGTMAEKLGISVSSIRNYEAEGLILSHRTDSGHRLFSLEDVDRVKLIQRMIQEEGLNIEGIRRMQAMLPCWEILPCSQQKQKKCPAFKDKTKPCWMIKDLDCARGELEKCRNCIVYRFGSLCIEHVKDLVHDRTDNDNIRSKMEAIVNKVSKQ